MKAMVVTAFGGPEVLRLTEVDSPVAGPNQVLIRVEATSVNFADIKARYGKYHNGAKPPFIPGLDAAGVIEEVGPGVTRFQRGQRVIAFPLNGSYAEYVLAEEQLTFVLPDSLDFATAAACPLVSFTSYKLLADVARLAPLETVLIHSAAGGIGTTASQLARVLGAGRIIGTVGRRDKAATALASGCDDVICYTEVENFDEKVMEVTNGEGADVILDSIGGWVAEKSMACLAPYGRFVNFGNSSGEPGKFKTTQLHSSCRSVLGYSLGTTIAKRPQLLQDTASHVLNYLSEGKVQIRVGRRFSLDDASEAHRFMESRQSTGKLVLEL